MVYELNEKSEGNSSVLSLRFNGSDATLVHSRYLRYSCENR
jgi:hypothetical protein